MKDLLTKEREAKYKALEEITRPMGELVPESRGALLNWFKIMLESHDHRILTAVKEAIEGQKMASICSIHAKESLGCSACSASRLWNGAKDEVLSLINSIEKGV